MRPRDRFCFLPSAFGFLLTAFCILPSLSCCLLPTSFAHRKTFAQNLFLRSLDRHSVTRAVLIDWTMLEHIGPLLAQRFDFPQSIFGITYGTLVWSSAFKRDMDRNRRLFGLHSLGFVAKFLCKARRALETRLGRHAFFRAQRHGRRRRILIARFE